MAGKHTSPYFLRFGKIKTAQRLLVAGHHNNRERQVPHSDPLRASLNYTLTQTASATAITKLARSLLKSAGLGNGVGLKPLRKNAVYAIEILFSLPANFTGDHQAYFLECLSWITTEFCDPELVLAAHVHQDEGAPHMHVLILPLLQGKMCASKLLGNRKQIQAYQDSFYTAVASRHGFPSIRNKTPQLTRKDHAQRVIRHIRTQHPELLQSPLWQVFRDKILKDPDSFLDALGNENSSLKTQNNADFKTPDSPVQANPNKTVSRTIPDQENRNSLCSVGDEGEPAQHTDQPKRCLPGNGRPGPLNEAVHLARASLAAAQMVPSSAQHPTALPHTTIGTTQRLPMATLLPSKCSRHSKPNPVPTENGKTLSHAEIANDFEKTNLKETSWADQEVGAGLAAPGAQRMLESNSKFKTLNAAVCWKETRLLPQEVRRPDNSTFVCTTPEVRLSWRTEPKAQMESTFSAVTPSS